MGKCIPRALGYKRPMSTPFGTLIRHWRDIRRFSQLALSAETGISSRHISFLETGRARPSRSSVLTLARVLDMPKLAVNKALLAAGFAPEYPTHELSDEDLAPLMSALTTILDNHAPMPAIVIDAGWQIIGGNAPAMEMINFLPFNGSLCTVDALLNDDPNDPIFLNWETIATWTLMQLQSESSHAGENETLVGLHKRLASDPRLQGRTLGSFAEQGPFLTLQVRAGDQTLSMFTMLAEFTTAQDIAMSERRVELFFPADDATRDFFENL